MIGIFFVCLLTCYDIVLVLQPPPFQKNWLMAPSTTIGPDVMYAGRFILGIGVGIEGGGVGVYISESVPSNKRGSLVSLYQLSIALGEVLGYAIAAIFYEVHGGWRFMVGSSLVFSTIVLIGLFFLPESPRYLVFKGSLAKHSMCLLG